MFFLLEKNILFEVPRVQKSLKNDAKLDAKARVGKNAEKVIKMVANGSQKSGKMESGSPIKLKSGMLSDLRKMKKKE